MTMRKFVWLALGAAGLLVGGSATWAQEDTIRLGGPSALTEIQGGTNLELTRGGGHGGGHGGFHGGGFHGGYGGYRGGYGGYGRYYGGYGGYGYGRYGYGYGRGYGYGYGFGYPLLYASLYRGYGYGGYGYGGGYPYYYNNYYSTPYYPNYMYTPAYGSPICANDYYAPLSVASSPTPQVLNFPAAATTNYQPSTQKLFPFSNDGTYGYNGGPANSIQMPVQPARASVPLEGKLVTLPNEIRGGVSSAPSDTQRLRYTPSATTPTRVQYPAYGE
jgi:hypothetical protein